jgi:uncharacterized membrane protein YgcG
VNSQKNKRKRRQRLIAVISVIVIAAMVVTMIAVPALASASASSDPAAVTAAVSGGYDDSDPEDYITEAFDVRMTADTAHRIAVTEKIRVNFIREHHGIYRDIPNGGSSYTVENVRVADRNYTVSGIGRSGSTRIRIGDEDTYLRGEHTYRITYDLIWYKDEAGGADALAQNLLPVNWMTSIREADLTLTMPKAVDWNSMEYYAGPKGSTGGLNSRYFTKSVSSDGKTLTIHGSNLPKGYGVTVRGSLPEQYWSQAQTYARAHRQQAAGTAVILCGAAVFMLILFLIFGRDPKIVRTVEFRPPGDLTPLEAGYLIDGKADNEDFMSMILYFASRGYLSIKETKTNAYALVKEKEIAPEEPAFAVTLFHGLFRRKNEVPTTKIPTSFLGDMDRAKTQLFQKYRGREGRIFRPGCKGARAVGILILIVYTVIGMAALYGNHPYHVIFLVALMLAGIYFLVRNFDHRYSRGTKKGLAAGIICCLIPSGGISVGLGVTQTPWLGAVSAGTMLTILVCMVFMRARSKENALIMGRLLGFRDFIRTAEYDRLKMLSAEDPAYFYDVLPYAAVMGMSTEWAEKFTDIQVPQPEWYSTCDGRPFVYSPLWCGTMMERCVTDSTPVPPSDSGGSYGGGSFGGGFSGGGGGGGGGGAW